MKPLFPTARPSQPSFCSWIPQHVRQPAACKVQIISAWLSASEDTEGWNTMNPKAPGWAHLDTQCVRTKTHRTQFWPHCRRAIIHTCTNDRIQWGEGRWTQTLLHPAWIPLFLENIGMAEERELHDQCAGYTPTLLERSPAQAHVPLLGYRLNWKIIRLWDAWLIKTTQEDLSKMKYSSLYSKGGAE